MRDLKAALAQRRQASLYRQRRVVNGAQTVEQSVDGQRVLSFCSNDYLGLAADPRVTAAFKQAADRYGVGSGASHLINGHSEAHHALEMELADFTGRDRALLFSTGYMANLGVLTALMERGDTVLGDKLMHASLIDAAHLSAASLQRFAHNDLAKLQQLLAQTSADSLVVTEGVFSMDGDTADLPVMAGLCKRHKAWMMVDDAHGFGVLGETGAGSLQAQGLDQQQVPVMMATLGKGLGCFGAFVAGSEELIETLVQLSRSYIYTTALPSAVAVATQEALRICRTENWRREHLQARVQQFREGAATLGLELGDSTTAIQPIVVGSAESSLAWSEVLQAEGIQVVAIRPPTVPAGSARLRVSFSATHQADHVNCLLVALARAQESACK